ncbi:MAG TPA: FecR domain-containing protein [Polyangiaceae bacterium]
MTDAVGRLLETYAGGLEAQPHATGNVNRLEQRVRSTLRERAVERNQTVQRLQAALAVAAACALLAGGGAYRLAQRPAPSAEVAASAPAGEWLSTTGAAQERAFADGSSLRLESASSARVQFGTKTGGLVHLDRGAVRLKVQHRDGSSWRVAAGPYEVEAIGTEFVVDWVADRDKPLRVSVTEGTVAVRGPAFRGTRFVSAHQMVEVTGQEAASAVTDLPLEPALEPPATDDAATNGARQRGSEPSWRALEAAGKYADAVRVAERRGLSSVYQTGSADDLMALSRAARFAGRADVARDASMACRARFAGLPQAALSAFLLGRAASGAQAAQWFSAYLKEQPNGALAREALGRLIEAYQAAGDRVSGRAAAERYLKSYPDGPHATLAHEALHR